MKRFLPPLLALLAFAASCSRPEPKPAAEATPEATTRQPAARVNDPADWVSRRHVEILAALIAPAKLDTLKGDRAANGRLRKICYWLKDAESNGSEPEATLDIAQQRAGYGGTARAREDKKALLRNLTILERLGCLTDDGMAKLRKGQAPTITRGPYAGEIVEVDHILPRSRFPELDEKLFNLEFMPATMNRKKSDGMGQRQQALEAEWRKAGLL